MKIRCKCGNLMHDEKLETCDVYSFYLNEDYHSLLDSNPKSIEELVDKMPCSGIFWKCKNCGKIFYFGHNKLITYKIEEEIPD